MLYCFTINEIKKRFFFDLLNNIYSVTHEFLHETLVAT